MKTLINIVKTTTLAALVACGAPSRADDPSAAVGTVSRSVAVTHADLNLANPAGVDALYLRLQAATRKVCAPRPASRNLNVQRDWKRCVTTTLDDAVARLENTALARVHFLETGRPESFENALATSQAAR
jgi:UrcA family protein